MNNRSRLATWALLLGSVVIAVLLAEAILRIPGVRPPLQSEYMVDYPGARVPHPRLLVANPTWLQTERYRAIPGKQPTIVAIGDSFTEGAPVRPADAYPAVLEKRLNAAGWNAQVINAAFGDSGPGQQLRLFSEIALPITKPDIVIWSFYWNDVSDEWLFPIQLLQNGKLVDNPDLTNNWMFRRQELVEHSPTRYLWRHSALMRLGLKLMEREQGKEVPAGADRQEWGAAKICAAIKQMEELARQRGFTLWLLHMVPEVNYLPGPARQTMPWPVALDRLLSQQFGCAQSARVIKAWFPAADPNAIFAGPPRERLPVGSRHFNEAGYAMVADLVARQLLEGSKPAAAASQPR